jgi:hypothetical protein
MSNCVPAYHVSHKAWYSTAIPNNELHIMIGMYSKDGGCEFEFMIR